MKHHDHIMAVVYNQRIIERHYLPAAVTGVVKIFRCLKLKASIYILINHQCVCTAFGKINLKHPHRHSGVFGKLFRGISLSPIKIIITSETIRTWSSISIFENDIFRFRSVPCQHNIITLVLCSCQICRDWTFVRNHSIGGFRQ